MGVLTKNEIKAYIEKGELLSNPRRTANGEYDVQPDSYDLTAGKAIWKDSNRKVSPPLLYQPDLSVEEQGTHCLLPGEMVFVMTHENILMPKGLCGTVYTKNRLAMAGILALNAGHVDPGYCGPIVIRLINIRSEPWVLRMGTPIFSIVFQTLNEEASEGRPSISDKEMLERVEESASNSMGNALYDLYALEVEKRLLEHQSGVEEKFRQTMAKNFIQRNEFWSVCLKNTRAKIAAAIVFLAILGGLLFTGLNYFGLSPTAQLDGEGRDEVELNLPACEPASRLPHQEIYQRQLQGNDLPDFKEDT